MCAVRLEQPRHRAWERAIAQRLAEAWGYEWGQMGAYSPIDVYFLREKRLAALLEIRTRQARASHDFPRIMLDLDKWFHLVNAEIALSVPAFYAVAFSDGIWCVRIGSLPVNRYQMNFRGRTDRPESPNDRSPVIEIPTSEFSLVATSDGVFDVEENAS